MINKIENVNEVTAAIKTGNYQPDERMSLFKGDATVEEISSLIEAIKEKNKKPNRQPITSLNLASSNIDAKGAAIIANALKDLPHVKHLNLSDNKIGDDGFLAFADIMADNKTLETLDLSSNKLNHDYFYVNTSLGKLAIAISKNTKLKMINLSHNWTKSFWPDNLISPLLENANYSPAVNSTLCKIILRDSFNSQSYCSGTANCIFNAVTKNPNLTELQVSGMDLYEKDIMWLAVKKHLSLNKAAADIRVLLSKAKKNPEQAGECLGEISTLYAQLEQEKYFALDPIKQELALYDLENDDMVSAIARLWPFHWDNNSLNLAFAANLLAHEHLSCFKTAKEYYQFILFLLKKFPEENSIISAQDRERFIITAITGIQQNEFGVKKFPASLSELTEKGHMITYNELLAAKLLPEKDIVVTKDNYLQIGEEIINGIEFYSQIEPDGPKKIHFKELSKGIPVGNLHHCCLEWEGGLDDGVIVFAWDAKKIFRSRISFSNFQKLISESIKNEIEPKNKLFHEYNHTAIYLQRKNIFPFNQDSIDKLLSDDRVRQRLHKIYGTDSVAIFETFFETEDIVNLEKELFYRVNDYCQERIEELMKNEQIIRDQLTKDFDDYIQGKIFLTYVDLRAAFAQEGLLPDFELLREKYFEEAKQKFTAFMKEDTEGSLSPIKDVFEKIDKMILFDKLKEQHCLRLILALHNFLQSPTSLEEFKKLRQKFQKLGDMERLDYEIASVKICLFWELSELMYGNDLSDFYPILKNRYHILDLEKKFIADKKELLTESVETLRQGKMSINVLLDQLSRIELQGALPEIIISEVLQNLNTVKMDTLKPSFIEQLSGSSNTGLCKKRIGLLKTYLSDEKLNQTDKLMIIYLYLATQQGLQVHEAMMGNIMKECPEIKERRAVFKIFLEAQLGDQFGHEKFNVLKKDLVAKVAANNNIIDDNVIALLVRYKDIDEVKAVSNSND